MTSAFAIARACAGVTEADVAFGPAVAKPVSAKGRGKKAVKPALQLTATSIVQRDDLLLFTLADSFRVRVLAPPREGSSKG